MHIIDSKSFAHINDKKESRTDWKLQFMQCIGDGKLSKISENLLRYPEADGKKFFDDRHCEDMNEKWPECSKEIRAELEGPKMCGALKTAPEFSACGRKFKNVVQDIFG